MRQTACAGDLCMEHLATSGLLSVIALHSLSKRGMLVHSITLQRVTNVIIDFVLAVAAP